jgi:hypothetical protein
VKGLFPIYNLQYKGSFSIYVLIDSTPPQSVDVLSSPDEEITKAAVDSAYDDCF